MRFSHNQQQSSKGNNSSTTKRSMTLIQLSAGKPKGLHPPELDIMSTPGSMDPCLPKLRGSRLLKDSHQLLRNWAPGWLLIRDIRGYILQTFQNFKRYHKYDWLKSLKGIFCESCRSPHSQVISGWNNCRATRNFRQLWRRMWHFRFGLYSSELRGIGVAAMTPIADQHASAGGQGDHLYTQKRITCTQGSLVHIEPHLYTYRNKNLRSLVHTQNHNHHTSTTHTNV